MPSNAALVRRMPPMVHLLAATLADTASAIVSAGLAGRTNAGASAQLAVLAAAAVVAGGAGLFAIERLLAGDTQAHAWHRLAPRLGNGRAALLAMRQPRPPRQLAAGALDRILHGRVDLVLHRVVACPARCHGRLQLVVPIAASISRRR